MDNNKRNESLLNIIARLETRYGFVETMWQQTRKQVDSAFVHSAEIEAKNAGLKGEIAGASVTIERYAKMIHELKVALAAETNRRIELESQIKTMRKNAQGRGKNGRFK